MVRSLTKVPLLLVVLLSVILGGCAAGAPESGARRTSMDEQPIPRDLEDDVARSEEYGRAIYLQDAASWMATDALHEEIGRLDEAGLGGWLAYLESNALLHPTDTHLIEFLSTETPPRVAYRIRVTLGSSGEPTVTKVTPPEALDPSRLTLWRARQAAIDSLSSHPQMLNTVILPAHDGTAYVYLLAATKQENVAVLGQHHRIEVSLEDASIVESFAMSKSMIEYPLQGPQGEEAVALGTTHLVSEYPLETHVWASLLYKRPLYVSTSRGLWRITRGVVAYLGPLGEGAAGGGTGSAADR